MKTKTGMLLILLGGILLVSLVLLSIFFLAIGAPEGLGGFYTNYGLIFGALGFLQGSFLFLFRKVRFSEEKVGSALRWLLYLFLGKVLFGMFVLGSVLRLGTWLILLIPFALYLLELGLTVRILLIKE